MEFNKIYNMDCLEGLKQLPDNSVDCIITDPPYGLSFMGKKWDYDVPSVEIWKECLRVLKYGGYLLAFAGTRTQHRMAVRIEDAGFEIRDMIAWVYGSGFPKSLNIGKAVDKLQGNEREFIGIDKSALRINSEKNHKNGQVGEFGLKAEGTGVITKGTSEWEGWGTALKPALEPITVARKPLSEKTVVENVLKWGTGGINIDACRISTNEELGREQKDGPLPSKYGFNDNNMGNKFQEMNQFGRFPANFIHNGSKEVLDLFPNTNGAGNSIPLVKITGYVNKIGNGTYEYDNSNRIPINSGSGSASRFFYCAKTSNEERNKGCENLNKKQTGGGGGIVDYIDDVNSESGKYESEKATNNNNNHPTVKPVDLMEYLIKLVSRKNAIVLDPFIGSGSTIVACKNLERQYIGFEIDKEYFEIAQKRIHNASLQKKLNF